MYIILFSGGISSFEVTVKILNCQKKDVKMWFIDTKIEDPDTYRFIKDSENISIL
jgi:3'-phosphoadenosine 5'-phosphosulfate sulfotransferase (PAPS reductase)/FAD synthetase